MKNLEPLAEAIVGEFSKYDFARTKLMEAGWVPHYTMPFDSLSAQDSSPDVLQKELLDHYTSEWGQIRSTIHSRVLCYAIDDDCKASFLEAICAHEIGLYRCVPRLLYPEIERLLRIEMNIDGHISPKCMAQMLTERGSNLTKVASIEDFIPNGLFELELFDLITAVMDTKESLSASRPSPGLYEQILGANSMGLASASPIPNRHAVVHGLVAYASAQSSLNMIFIADYYFQAISSIKKRV